MTHDKDFEDRNFPKFDNDEDAIEWHMNHLAEKIEKSKLKESQQQEQIEQEYGDLTGDQFEKELTDRYHFKATKDNEDLFYYDPINGIYIEGGEWLVKQESIIFNPRVKTNDVNDIKNRIIWSNYANREDFDKDIDWICCSNKMVNIRTGEIKEHSPDFMATIQIPHELKYYKCPHINPPQKILKFLHEVLASYEDVETVLDFIAYCFLRSFPFHRFHLFNGSGRNGKGVTTELITRFLGSENVCNETLHNILENNFATANLYGKMVNIDADLSGEQLKQTGTLKKLTGNDWIRAEFKFKKAFHFKNYAKFIFSANNIPISPDESDAFFARPIIINFPKQFLGKDADPYLTEKLTTPEEMSCLLSLILKRLPRVLKNGISTKNTIEDNRVKYRESSDPIGLFIEQCVRKSNPENNYWTTKDDAYACYERFCATKKLTKESSYGLSRGLTNHGFIDKQKRVNGKQERVWLDMMVIDYKEHQESLD